MTKFWLKKPKTTSWLNTLKKILFVRKKTLKKKSFSKNNTFSSFTKKLKVKIYTKKQKQILTAIAKTKKKNYVLYGKIIHLTQQNQPLILKKILSQWKNEILQNQIKIQKLKKFYEFLLLSTPKNYVKRKSLKNIIFKEIQQKKLQFLWTRWKKKTHVFHRTRFLKKEVPFILLKLQAHNGNPQWNFLKKKSLLKQALYLNFLMALLFNTSFSLKNFFLEKHFRLKNHPNKSTQLKKITFPSLIKNLKVKSFLKSTLLSEKKIRVLKKSPYLNTYYNNYLWFSLRKIKMKKNKLDLLKKFQIARKKNCFNKYKNFWNQGQFFHVQRKKNELKQLTKINNYIKKNKIANYYKYRLPYRKNYFHFLQLNTNFRLKYLIQDFIQNYFSLQMEAKIVHTLNEYKNKNYFRLAFPIRKKKRQQLLKKHRSSQWNQKRILLTSRWEIATTLNHKQKINVKKNKIAEKDTKILMKEKLLILSEKKRFNRRIGNDFQRISRSKDFRYQFKYILPTLMEFSQSLEPQLLADVLAKLISKAKKQTWMLNSIKLLLQLIPLPRTIGYKIVLTGRINSKNKTRAIYITKKQITLQVFSTKMNFAYAQAKARIGTFGLKIWVYSRKPFQNEKNYNLTSKYKI